MAATTEFYYDSEWARRFMSKAVHITSPSNPMLKDVRRAVARGSLTADGLLIAETFHLLEEAVRSKLPVPMVLAAAGVRSTVEDHLDAVENVRVVVVADSVLQEISGTETAQGVIALVRPPPWKLQDLFAGVPLLVILDGVQDPGNAGAIVRAAEAFGATGVVFLKGAVSPFNTKTIRASAGSLFRLPFVSGVEAQPVNSALLERKLRLYAADPRGNLALAQTDLRGPAALVVGSENQGVSQTFRQKSETLQIPTRGVESLNAAQAAAVLLYEAARQREAGKL